MNLKSAMIILTIWIGWIFVGVYRRKVFLIWILKIYSYELIVLKFKGFLLSYEINKKWVCFCSDFAIEKKKRRRSLRMWMVST